MDTGVSLKCAAYPVNLCGTDSFLSTIASLVTKRTASSSEVTNGLGRAVNETTLSGNYFTTATSSFVYLGAS